MSEDRLAGFGILTAIVFAGLILVVPIWVTFRKAGLSPALSLLAFIPYVGPFFVLLILGVSRWPATEE